MLKSLITYLNLKLDLLNYFDLTRCLVELKDNSEGTRQPVEYISNGNYDVIDWDEFNGVSYWRLRDEITSDRTEEKKYKAGARNNIETTVPLKLVFAVPRTKLTEDDAYSFDRIRQTMVKQFAIDDDVIKTTLQAESVRINVVSANSDAKEVWEEETESTGTFEPKYETIFGSIDVDVVIISKHSCLPTECDDVESDIIRAFDWCGNTAVTVGRLTEAQQTCISDFICSCADGNVENSNGSYTNTVASGGTLVLPDITVTDSDGSTSSVPSVQDVTCTPCADATVELNGIEVTTVASGGTVDIPVNLDGVPSGSWDGDSWEVTSNPCADATVQLNGVDMADIASGDTENIQVRQSSGSTLVGSKQGQYWRIDDSAISINGSFVADVRAEDSLDIDVLQDSLPVGSWNGSAWIVPPCSGGGSIEVTVSDSSPSIGDTITITGTASGFTPTNYLFLTYDGTTIEKISEQAGNTYNWTVNRAESYDIYVVSDDGSIKAWNKVEINASGNIETVTFMTSLGIDPDGTLYYPSTAYERTGLQLYQYVDSLVTAVKSIGWSKFKAIYPILGGTVLRHRVNLINPNSFILSFAGGWTHSATGTLPNGSNSFADTGIVPSDELSLNSSSMGYYSRTDVNANVVDMGVRLGSTYSIIQTRANGSSYYLINQSALTSAVVGDSLGFFVGNRKSASVIDGWKAGTKIIAGTNSSSTLPTNTIYLGALNQGTPTLYTSRECAFAFVGDGLTDTDVVDLSSAVQSFNTSLGREV